MTQKPTRISPRFRGTSAQNPPGAKACPVPSLGNALMNQGNFSQAAVAYAQALTNNPESPQVTNNLGSALYRLGRYEQAIVCYKKAISLKINHAEALSLIHI